ncbi:Ubiquitin thioesterase otubain-like [Lachnellula suecica]|uniref:Ubiquitin thioesterase otubain-like n=1 Tax=Lachnellula suecica TaxID=602035 RepID=A0A8T9C4S8_9HELO|nr:Ubiquitin thioesterase otubain-like [Lachnellula suecica]
MFQPQPTPYSPFSAYGISPSAASFPGFQPVGPVDSGGPTAFRDPLFHPAPNVNAGRLNYTNHNNPPRPYKMEGMSDMEAQEAMARDFQPALEGPLVGEKKSSHAITEEYAKADPIYVAKTAASISSCFNCTALTDPRRCRRNTPIIGLYLGMAIADGGVGLPHRSFNALLAQLAGPAEAAPIITAGFSYFETLLRQGSKALLDEEVARMTSLDNLLTTVGGFEAWLFEDMVLETTNLLRDMADLVQTNPQGAADLLLQRFNDPEISNAIVYHFRLLASSWLKGSSDEYLGFIPENLGVDGYTKNWLEPVNQEIDHLGMSLLIDVLLKPIGFAVEIVYLDRSEGSQVNAHLIQRQDSNGVPTDLGGPVIHLLYRPSHYDILYKEAAPLRLQAVNEVARNVQVNRATNFSHQHSIQSTPMGEFSPFDLQALLSIPGFSMPPSHHGFPPQYQPPIDQTYAPSPISSISPISPSASSATTPSSSVLPAAFPTQQPPTSSLASPTLTAPHQTFPPTTALPIHSHLPPPPHRPTLNTHHSFSTELSSPSSAGSSFRPSKYEFQSAADWAQEGPVQFQTSTFKNSHYNTAHYNNPNFQPEEWSPEAEEQQMTRKKSS